MNPLGEIDFTTPDFGNNLVGPDLADDPTLDAGLVVVEDPTTQEPTEPVTPEPTEPVTPGPTEPVTPEPTEPVTPEPTDPATPQPTDPATPGPSGTETPEAPVVDQLPSTGSGSAASATLLIAAVASVVLLAGALGITQSKRS